MKTLHNLHTAILLLFKLIITLITAGYMIMRLEWMAPSVVTTPLWSTLLFAGGLVTVMYYKDFLKVSIFKTTKRVLAWSIILEALLLIILVIRIELLWEILSDRRGQLLTTSACLSGFMLVIHFLPRMIKSRRKLLDKKPWHQYTTGKRKN